MIYGPWGDGNMNIEEILCPRGLCDGGSVGEVLIDI